LDPHPERGRHQAIARKIALSGWEMRKNGIGIWSRMPWPTTSLDSAVTLVPEGGRGSSNGSAASPKAA